jgi:hypothetical protein
VSCLKYIVIVDVPDKFRLLKRLTSSNDFMSSQSEMNGSDLVKNSTLYREFQAEREEILKHKWIESEKAGYDIGFEHALTDWIIKHRSKWRRARQSTSHAA